VGHLNNYVTATAQPGFMLDSVIWYAGILPGKLFEVLLIFEDIYSFAYIRNQVSLNAREKAFLKSLAIPTGGIFENIFPINRILVHKCSG
jgi:hypothetical protein